MARTVRDSIEHWGEGDTIDWAAPSLASSAIYRRVTGTLERAAMSPSMARAMWERINDCDIRQALAAIRVPTLVLHHEGGVIPVAQGRYLVEHIVGARYVELPGADHAPVGVDMDRIAGEIEEFVTGTRHAADPDRVLATVLFTDIVDSTSLAATLGDLGWREVRERHDAFTRAELERFGGREVKHTGDGVLAAFDGPARAIRCAQALCKGARDLGVELRAGLHTGECELIGDDLGGIAVHIGARVGSLARPSEVLVTHTVKDLVVGSGIVFVDRGDHELKGVPENWRLYALGTTETNGPALSGPAALADPVKLRLADRAALMLARRAPAVPRAALRIPRWRRSRR